MEMKLGDTQVTTDLRDVSKQQLFPGCCMSTCLGSKRGSSSPVNAKAKGAGRLEWLPVQGEATQRA